MTDSTGQDKLVGYAVVDGAAILELRNAPANCYSYAMMRELDEAILAARFDEDVHVIVLRGAGDKFFCAGADIKMLDGVTPEYKYYFCLHANETLSRLEHTPKLTIAALNGHCVGGGLEVALACDLRVARRGAGKIGLPEVKLGVLPGTGGTQRLPRVLGKTRALEWMVTGRSATFEEALAEGLVTHVWDDADFDARVLEYAHGFCPPHAASEAVGLIKRSVQSGTEMSLQDGLSLERELQRRLFATRDAAEGIRAYVEKRAPDFQGR
ncbi:MAG: enoyl-CoA hydratase/isomerase family protein [Planctomycetota bacterium]